MLALEFTGRIAGGDLESAFGRGVGGKVTTQRETSKEFVSAKGLVSLIYIENLIQGVILQSLVRQRLAATCLGGTGCEGERGATGGLANLAGLNATYQLFESVAKNIASI